MEQTNDLRELDRRAEMIRNGFCPVCGKGPLMVPLSHASRAHGLDRFAMRDLCGMTYTESACDPAYSETCRDRWTPRPKNPPPPVAGRRFSLAARRKAITTLREWQDAVGPSVVREQRLAANSISTRAHRRPHPCSVCGAIIEKGQRVTCSDACASVACHPKSEA